MSRPKDRRPARGRRSASAALEPGANRPGRNGRPAERTQPDKHQLASPGSDDHQQHITLADSVADVFAKIDTQRNIVDVEEDGVWAKVLLQFVVQRGGNIRSIVTTI